jgi:hypothetical protein
MLTGGAVRCAGRGGCRASAADWPSPSRDCLYPDDKAGPRPAGTTARSATGTRCCEASAAAWRTSTTPRWVRRRQGGGAGGAGRRLAAPCASRLPPRRACPDLCGIPLSAQFTRHATGDIVGLFGVYDGAPRRASASPAALLPGAPAHPRCRRPARERACLPHARRRCAAARRSRRPQRRHLRPEQPAAQPDQARQVQLGPALRHQ